MNNIISNSKIVTHAHVILPCDTLHLVTELVKRLRGEVLPQSQNEELFVMPQIPEKERMGRMLKGLRLRANLTQKTLSKAINVPQSHISEYEASKRPIPKDKVALLAELLKTVESHFLGFNS